MRTKAESVACGGTCGEAPKDSGDLLNADVKVERVTRLRVAGVDCQEEVAAIRKALSRLEGVHSVQTNILTGRSTVQHAASVEVEPLLKAIARTGLKARVEDDDAGEADDAGPKRERSLVVLSGLLTGIGLVLAWFLEDAFWPRIAFGGAVLAGGILIFPQSIRALAQRRLDMNVLMAIAVTGALGIGEWAEAATVVFLFSLSELLESLSVGRARRAIQSLVKVTPKTALRLRDGNYEVTAVAEIAVGEIVAIRSGERIPLDGVVRSGLASVDQSPITGESVPVDRGVGQAVFAGSVATSGSLEIRVSKRAGETMLARIISMIEEAQARKAPSQRFVDVFARYYTPAVVLAALLVFLLPPLFAGAAWHDWFYRSLVLLVIACPCALVIATPVSIVSGLTAMARRGVLIKGGVFLEALGRLRSLALDKTGTVTEGRPQLLSVLPWKEPDEMRIVSIAAAIDVHSTHPLAQAIVRFAEGRGLRVERAEHFSSLEGRGARGVVEGRRYFVGNQRLVREEGIHDEALEGVLRGIEASGRTALVVAETPGEGRPGRVLGVMEMADAPRVHAKRAIEALHRAGIRKIVILSGDNQNTVDAIARQVGVAEGHGELLPEDKIAVIRQLLKEDRFVGMVGDGVNDGPALAAATVGIAMGAGGSDAAIEVADVALMHDDLEKVAEAVGMGRRTLAMIRFNIAFALAMKAVFLLLAVMGLAGLWAAIAADTGATLLVVANSLRLLRSRPAAG